MNRSRILCVDDNHNFLITLRLALEHHGFKVVTAAHGLEALRQFRDHSGKFDVILTDNDMPHMNGLDLVRSVLKEGFAGRIVVMSGNLKPEQRQAYQACPVNGFAQKPFEVRSIIATLLQEN